QPDNVEARARLDAMVRTTDGFELADEDLRLRGEGTLFDVKQSGLPDLKLARLADDAEVVRRARSRAFEVIDADPGLDRHPELLDLLRPPFPAGPSSGCSISCPWPSPAVAAAPLRVMAGRRTGT